MGHPAVTSDGDYLLHFPAWTAAEPASTVELASAAASDGAVEGGGFPALAAALA